MCDSVFQKDGNSKENEQKQECQKLKWAHIDEEHTIQYFSESLFQGLQTKTTDKNIFLKIVLKNYKRLAFSSPPCKNDKHKMSVSKLDLILPQSSLLLSLTRNCEPLFYSLVKSSATSNTTLHTEQKFLTSRSCCATGQQTAGDWIQLHTHKKCISKSIQTDWNWADAKNEGITIL